jgi:hypothetical protein
MKKPGRWRVLLIGVVSAVMSSAAVSAQTPLTPLASFTSSPNSLIQYLDGNFYGTSGFGAGSTFFRMTPAGAVTVLHTFTAAEGGGALTLGADGNFYGNTPTIFTSGQFQGFSSRAFRITPSGSVTLLASFTGVSRFGLQASDGFLYGNAEAISCFFITPCLFTDFVFRMTFAGTITRLSTFNPGGTSPRTLRSTRRPATGTSTARISSPPHRSLHRRIIGSSE